MLLLPILLALVQGPPDTRSGPVYSGRSHQLAVRPPRRDTTITIDGSLDEPVWREAALMNGFSQYTPRDGVPAADSTQVLVWYSPTAIYFGIRAFEPADQVRATLADRDKIDQDDYVQILLGTFNDGRQASVFMVNPLGIQEDGTLVEKGSLPGGGFMSAVGTREAPDYTPDFVYQSKGRLMPWGYEVEVRIPFKSLRYQSTAVQSWGINVVRRVQYRGHEDSWAPAMHAAASFLAQGGELAGLTGLRRGLVVDLTPEATQRTNGAPDASTPPAWRYSAREPSLGGSVRWGVTNDLTLDGTVNPDFSQVEADATQISFDPRTALLYPEKRPFFLDGSEHFQSPNSLVYTRRVVQPVAAVKLAGKTAGSDIALLSAVDAASASTSGRDNPVFNIVRLQHDVGPQSRLGMLYSDRIDGTNWNRVLDADGRLVWQKVYALQWQLAGSATEHAGVRTTAPLWDFRYLRNGRSFSWRSQFTGVGDDFRTESGFISRAGQVHANVNPSFAFFGRRGTFVEQYGGDVVLDGTWDYHNFQRHGDARDKKLHFDLNAQLRGGWTAGASLLIETFGFDPGYYGHRYRIEVPHANGQPSDTLAFTGTPRLPNRDWVGSVGTPQFRYLSFNVLGIWGQDENFYEWSSANIRYINLTANIRASDQLRIGITYLLNDYMRRSDGTRVGRQRDPRIKLEYQVTRSIFVRAIGEYFTDYTTVLRDDSRSNLPLLTYDSGSGRWIPTVEHTSNSIRPDFLFSYKPNPGTVFYVGYDAQLNEPDAFGFRAMQRMNDAFFVKASYLWRL